MGRPTSGGRHRVAAVALRSAGPLRDPEPAGSLIADGIVVFLEERAPHVRANLTSLFGVMLRSRNRYLLLLDLLLLPAATLLGFASRFEGWSWPAPYERVAIAFLAVMVPLKLATSWRAGLYRRLWRYASISDLECLLTVAGGAAAASLVVGAGVFPLLPGLGVRVPLSVLVIDAVLTLALLAAPRFFVRILQRQRLGASQAEGRRVLIVGAGAAGGLIVRELRGNPQLGMVPVGLVDDDRTKHGRHIDDVLVLGPLSQIPELVMRHGVQEIIIAMPAAPGSVVRSVLHAAHDVGVPTRTVPGLFEIISGRKSVRSLRSVEIEDLLRREPVRTDFDLVRPLATGRTVLVTGAGGSIGSELCRQILRLAPSRLVVLGRGENSIFELVQELTRTFPQADVEPVICDVRDRGALREVFRRFRPHSVFHAAAHKHVPLMERNPAEAVLNNVLGTANTVRLAAEFGVERFVLISTDKAVRPTSIMGATKRLAESVVQDVSQRLGKPYVSVRFGNVLGSRGSVVPTFLRQIEAGGPVTVTHPDMRRYFMTIPEAVQLVLQAGALGQGSETFVLDMGEPVKIADLAADLIRLSGLEVGTDIEIKFTGIRPGEKLYEELFFGAECATPTVHPKVLRANTVAADEDCVAAIEALIERAQRKAPAAELRHAIAQIVRDYRPPAEVAGPYGAEPSTVEAPVVQQPVGVAEGAGQPSWPRPEVAARVARSAIG